MKKSHNIINEINELTLKIEQDYPELYQYLDENPVTIPRSEEPQLNTKTFSDWLDSLKELLEHHIENHTKTLNK
jgi:hypothetical protein